MGICLPPSQRETGIRPAKDKGKWRIKTGGGGGKQECEGGDDREGEVVEEDVGK